MGSVLNRAFVWLQALLPKHLLTALIWRLARIENAAVKNWLIRRFVARYAVNVDEALLSVPDGYATFNAFFTRALQPDARPLAAERDVVVSPCDGTVSAAGRIDGDAIFQAKGLHYRLEELLATDLADARACHDGSFATLYLAPGDYHRVHCPLDAELIALRYVPGRLYSVNAATVAALPGLFTRNERLICRFRSSIGPLLVVFVGAMNVGSIDTPWTGTVRAKRKGVVEALKLDTGRTPAKLARGDLLGWFNMGSTVILLLPAGQARWLDSIVPGARVRTGTAIARLEAGPGSRAQDRGA